jgi:hypothetical protein
VRVLIVTREWSSWPHYAGSTWVPMQYLLGLQRLGVEACWIDHLSEVEGEAVHGLEYLLHRMASTAADFGFAERWCVVYAGGQECFGLPRARVEDAVRGAELLLSISGKGLPPPLPLGHVPRRAYVDVDPAFTQIWAEQVDMGLRDYDLFFTVGQNVGRAQCRAPSNGLPWATFFPPVVLDLWPACIDERCRRFSTVGDWWGDQRAAYEGEYYGGKREEFLRVIGVPRECEQRIELALSIYQHDHEDLELLTSNGWRLLDPARAAGDPRAYRDFIQRSRAEFSVAKGGYVKSRSGWISDRTACYLASGKPALVQSTGVESSLPTGAGLLTFQTPAEALAGLRAIDEDYLEHAQAARRLAERHFDARVVLGGLLERAGL